MVTTEQGRQQGLTLPAYITAALQLRGERPDWRPVRVQVRRQGLMSCATVCDARDGQGTDFFDCDSELFGRAWFPGRNVRLCSGLGCTCEEGCN